MEVATMATKLRVHLDTLDEYRTFFSASKQRIGIRRLIASKANVDFQDVVNLEFYGLNGCDPQKADRIFQALAEATQKGYMPDSEKFRLLSKANDVVELENRIAAYRRDREMRCY
jgi:hypothetical protein